jgi:hypothetical protein
MKTLFTTQDMSETLKQVADTNHELNAKLVAQMHAGVAHFFFTKKDGSVREAYGTLNKAYLEKMLGPQDEEIPQGEPIPNSALTVQKYWDVEAMGFRAFGIDGLIAMF